MKPVSIAGIPCLHLWLCLALQASVAMLHVSARPAHAEGETGAPPVPDRLVVLTFDDSAASHATHVAPLLKKFGFGATFFITEGFNFTTNKKDYMTWKQISDLHQAGFEIGNHTRRHTAVSRQAPGEIDADIAFIEEQCLRHGIPKPVSFCYPGYATSKVAVKILTDRGYRFARAGGTRAFDPGKDHPLLLPQAFDGKPGSTFKQFVEATAAARNGRIAVMTFHGIPDAPHPWVSTAPDRFERYLQHLKDEGCSVIALRDVAKYQPANSVKQTTPRKAAVDGRHPVQDCHVLLQDTSRSEGIAWFRRNNDVLDRSFLPKHHSLIAMANNVQAMVVVPIRQSNGGTWGHGFAWTGKNNGQLHGWLSGYGTVNQAGLPCFLMQQRAQKYGVEHPEVDDAIAHATEVLCSTAEWPTASGPVVPRGESQGDIQSIIRGL